MSRELDLMFEELLEGSPASRRTFMRRLGASGFALTGASTLLAACGGIKGEDAGKAGGATKTPQAVDHPKTALDSLHISNWPLYIDKKVNKQFVKQFGVKDFKYTEDVNDNEEFFGKVRQQLAGGKPTGRDMMVLTDWMAARCVRLGYLEPLDKKNIPNAANLQDTLASPQWDPKRSYSLVWQSGMTGIGYNKSKVDRKITSYKDMFDPAFKGRVSFLADPRDAANFILLKNGKKPEDAKIDDVLAAIEELDKANRSGQIRRFTGNDYTTDLTKGNLWVSQVYSGDIVQLQADNPDLEFVIPEEGATIWSDNMLIPKAAADPYAAEVYMNYVYDPKVAAKIAAYVNYVTPVKGAKEELMKTDPKLASNQLIFPDDKTLAQLHPFVNLNEDDERRMNEAMQAVIGA
jgi:spermidine/putrescine transport system substrate-binding protein